MYNNIFEIAVTFNYLSFVGLKCRGVFHKIQHLIALNMLVCHRLYFEALRAVNYKQHMEVAPKIFFIIFQHSIQQLRSVRVLL